MMFKAAVFTSVFLFFSSVFALELSSDEKAFCSRIRSCTLDKIREDGDSAIPAPQMEAMVTSMCDSIIEEMRKEIAGHEELKPFFSACMKSMVDLGCSKLMEEDDVKTTACDKMKTEAENLGIVVD